MTTIENQTTSTPISPCRWCEKRPADRVDGVCTPCRAEGFPEGKICQIAPVESRRYWHNTIEINLADLYQRAPWISFQDTDTEEQK